MSGPTFLGLTVLKRFVSQLFFRAGYHLIPIWRAEKLDQSDFLVDLFRMYDVQLVIDVGANIGQFRDFMRTHCGYKGRLVSFEPNPVCIDQLLERAKRDASWEVRDVALGAEAGRLPLNVMRNNVFSSFLDPATQAVPELSNANTVVDRQTVEVRRLDALDLLNSDGVACVPVYLKLDTQGFDLEVLRGAQGMLPGIVAIQTEASILPTYQDMPDITRTIEALSEYGFSLAHASAVTRDSGLRAIEFDLIFVNDVWASPKIPTAGL